VPAHAAQLAYSAASLTSVIRRKPAERRIAGSEDARVLVGSAGRRGGGLPARGDYGTFTWSAGRSTGEGTGVQVPHLGTDGGGGIGLPYTECPRCSSHSFHSFTA
jgi:hypothetical protein